MKLTLRGRSLLRLFSSELISSTDFYPPLLDITSAKSKKGQVVDGIDLRAVWESTGPLQRDAICSDFIHHNPPTETVASSYVHQDNWKLIRFYADNPDQPDRFELYDLSVDIGETNDLSAKMPAKVKELNALIAAHLQQTDALVPFANPKYVAGAAKIQGWIPRGDASIRQRAGAIEVASSGSDPRIHFIGLPASSGPYTVKMRVKNRIKGSGSIYRGTADAPNFIKERQIKIDLKDNNQWHEYEVKVPLKESMKKLPIDPGSEWREAIFAWIRLEDKDGKTVQY